MLCLLHAVGERGHLEGIHADGYCEGGQTQTGNALATSSSSLNKAGEGVLVGGLSNTKKSGVHLSAHPLPFPGQTTGAWTPPSLGAGWGGGEEAVGTSIKQC